MRVGGVGTPHIAEFACAELGARLQMSPWSARRLVADALDVRHRLPLVWAQVVARRARVSNARRVAATTRHLSLEAAAGWMPRWQTTSTAPCRGAVRDPAGRQIVAADPALAAAREDAAPADQFAKRTRSSEQGTAGCYVRSTVGVVARLDATIGFLADALAAFGDPDTEDLRRVKAVALLANPVRAVELLAAFAALAPTPSTSRSTSPTPTTPTPTPTPTAAAARAIRSSRDPHPDLLLDGRVPPRATSSFVLLVEQQDGTGVGAQDVPDPGQEDVEELVRS